MTTHSSQSIRMDPNYNLLIGTPDPLSAGGASWRRHDRIAIGNECRGYQASALSSAEGRNFPSSRKLGKVPDTSKSLVPRLASALQPYRPALHCPSHLVLNDFRVCLILVVSRAFVFFLSSPFSGFYLRAPSKTPPFRSPPCNSSSTNLHLFSLPLSTSPDDFREFASIAC